MNYIDLIEKIIIEKHGTLMTSDLAENNIPRTYLTILVNSGRLERVGRGIYVAPNSIEDEMYYMQCKYPQIIYSHETALFLHGLSDRTSFEYSATVPSGYKVVANLAGNFKIYYVKRELHKLGVTEGKTAFGNTIKLYDVERTICDVLRSRSKIDTQIINDALKAYIKRNTADYERLMSYAKQLRVEKIVRGYLEVLL